MKVQKSILARFSSDLASVQSSSLNRKSKLTLMAPEEEANDR